MMPTPSALAMASTMWLLANDTRPALRLRRYRVDFGIPVMVASLNGVTLCSFSNSGNRKRMRTIVCDALRGFLGDMVDKVTRMVIVCKTHEGFIAQERRES